METTSFTRRRFPHWEVAGRSYFVTFRLRNSLPQNVVLRLKEQRDIILKQKDEKVLYEFQRHEFNEIEKILDNVNNNNNAFLTNEKIPPILMNAFEHLEAKYCWRFPAFVIMPNHIHCLCIADNGGQTVTLTEIFSLYKRFTARKINDTLKRKGRGWVDENFDHWCRTLEKEEGVKRYIANNPVKAKFVKNAADWSWKK